MVAAALPVDVQRDSLEIIIAAVAAFSTLAAVLVAMFGRAWRDSRRRPRLSLAADHDEVRTHYAVDAEERTFAEVVPVQLTLRNAPGKEPAREVELFLTAVGVNTGNWTDDPQEQYPKFEQVPLNLGSGRVGQARRTTATVAPGYVRKVTLGLVGDVGSFARERAPWGDDADNEPPPGIFNVAEPVDEEEPLMWPDCLYDLQIAVTGANFDAIVFAGRLRATSFHEPGPGGDGRSWWAVRVHWEVPLRRVRA